MQKRPGRYWLTVHFPPVRGKGVGVSAGIWVPRDRVDRFRALEVADGVAIYQTKGAPARFITRPDGTGERETFERGAGGVVAVANVTRRFEEPPITVAKHSDGSEVAWAQIAELEFIQVGGPVPLVEVNRILGYCPNARMRGSGGLRPISGEAFNALARKLDKPG